MQMEIVLKIKKQNLQKVKDLLLKDDLISRASVMFKEAKSLGLIGDDYYCYISGVNEACNKAKKLIKDLSESIKKEEEKKIIDKIKQEEESAMTGFGSIFG
jgi:uncharacterized protein YdbL (DUF1318 family)